MNHYSVSTLAEAMNASLPQGGEEVLITGGVSTDTRSIPSNALFFALRGENFDAHNFLEQAVDAGAAALVIDRPEAAPEGVPVIVVEDVLIALQRLACWYCAELDIPVIAITGSNGKTSTKDLTKAVLSQKFSVNATLGNLNNHIGLPLSVLATNAEHEVGIFEMGMNHPGEIAPLCQIARPDISIITNVGTAHIENMGSRQAIADEKGEVARALTTNGTLLVPANCDFVEYYKDRTAGKVLPVGNGRGAVRAENLTTDGDGSRFDLVIDGVGRVSASIPVTGKHMVNNAMLAAGAGHLLGLTLDEISAGLSDAVLTSGRLRQFDFEGIQVIDDTYNANPESVTAAVETLADLPCQGRRIACLGVMAELGKHASAAYQNLGELVAQKEIDQLLVVGAEAQEMVDSASKAGAKVELFLEAAPAAEWLKLNTKEQDLVLFKGSRAAAIERVMHQAYPEPNYP